MEKKRIRIDGAIEIPEKQTEDEFWETFLIAMRANGWAFCGVPEEMKDEIQEEAD